MPKRTTPTSVDSLISEIDVANSQEVLELGLESERDIDDETAYRIIDAIARNKRVKTVQVTNISMSPRTTADLFHTCLAHKRIENCILPLWRLLRNCPSQKPIMKLRDELPEDVAAYNAAQNRDTIAFMTFKRLNNKVFKCGSPTNITLHQLAEVLISDKIKPYLVGPKKNLTL